MKRRAIGYIRVSALMGREADNGLLSDKLQLESIERVCVRENLELIDVVKELDKSARAGKKRPLWEEQLRRIEDGEAECLVVWNLSRFSRSTLDALQAEKRIEDAGGKLYSEEGATSKLDRGIRYLLAEEESDRIKAGWDRIHERTLNEGVHFSSTVAVGYTREKRQALEIDPVAALAVVGLFERRAEGWNYSKLARWFNEQPGTKGTAGRTTIEHIIQNIAYLGHAHHGDRVKRNTHPAIVSQKLFDAANAIPPGQKKRGDGTMTAGMLLLGLARCASCGGGLSAVASQRKRDGDMVRVPGYTCKNLLCTDGVFIDAGDLDAYVERSLFRFAKLTGQTHCKRLGKADAAGAQKALDEAVYDRKAFIKNKELRRLLSEEEYAEELEELGRGVEAAQRSLDGVLEEASEDDIIALEDLWADRTMDEKRAHLAKAVECLEVLPAYRQKLHPAERSVLTFRETKLVANPEKMGQYRDGFRVVPDAL